jgi:hypothetical protein
MHEISVPSPRYTLILKSDVAGCLMYFYACVQNDSTLEVPAQTVANVVKMTGASLKKVFEALQAFEGDEEHAVMFLLLSSSGPSASKSHRYNKKAGPKVDQSSFGHALRTRGELEKPAFSRFDICPKAAEPTWLDCQIVVHVVATFLQLDQDRSSLSASSLQFYAKYSCQGAQVSLDQ